MKQQIRVDGSAPFTPSVGGFASRRSAHRHLFKHVARIAGLEEPEASSPRDVEAWGEIIDDPPLVADLRARRTAAKKKLEAIDGCALGSTASGDGSECAACANHGAMKQVDSVFGKLLGEYERAGASSLEWAFENPACDGPRLLAHRDQRTGAIVMKTVDSRRVVAVFALPPSGGEARLVTCYRKDKSWSCTTTWLELCREIAGHRRAGTSVVVEVCP
jgi:hypothetical protein